MGRIQSLVSWIAINFSVVRYFESKRTVLILECVDAALGVFHFGEHSRLWRRVIFATGHNEDQEQEKKGYCSHWGRIILIFSILRLDTATTWKLIRPTFTS